MARESRSPELIRQSIEETRRELAFSVNDLRSKMSEITDWRGQLTRNRGSALVGAAVAGLRDRRRRGRHDLAARPPPPLGLGRLLVAVGPAVQDGGHPTRGNRQPERHEPVGERGQHRAARAARPPARAFPSAPPPRSRARPA